MTAVWKAAGMSYIGYLRIASQTLRRSLKEDIRVAAERGGQSELRVSQWKDGKAGEAKDLNAANAAAVAANAASS